MTLPKEYVIEKSSQQEQHSSNRRTESVLASAYFTVTYAKSSSVVFLYPKLLPLQFASAAEVDLAQ